MFSRILEDLHAEHRTMRKLLELLQHQVELVAEERRPDGVLLLEIAEHFRGFCELFHHPKEELILHRVVANNADAATDLATLESDHEACSRELERFSRAVVRLLIEPNAGVDRFLSAALGFLEMQRRHLAWEEQNFFSLAERSLSQDDWKTLESSLSCFASTLLERRDQASFGRIDRALGHWRNRMAA